MQAAIPYLVGVLVILVVFVYPAWRSFLAEEAEARRLLAEAKAAGRHEPVSIRPWVNPDRCMGSGACISNCPEGKILQVLDGQARIVSGSDCIGHGACEAACPMGAIELVFGSERRGIEIPAVGPTFQSNVPGLYIAGELGGMGLIANAVDQGVQAVSSASVGLPDRAADELDLVIVGAGPAGIGAGLEALRRGVRFVVLEQEQFGGAIRQYPRAKVVMTRPFKLPGGDPVRKRTLTKEQLIEHLASAIEAAGLEISERERVDAVEQREDGRFTVRTSSGSLVTARVLLTVGRRGTPRRLGVPGEERAKVAYRLLDPEQFQHQHVLVVGGGDSALEAAIALGEQDGCRVTLSYRGDAFGRPKRENLSRLERSESEGRVRVLLGSEVQDIGGDRVSVKLDGEDLTLPNDSVFVFAGGVAPTQFLKAAGIRLERHFGKRIVDVTVQ